ncbi:Protein-tyrosine-phosphatase [Pseudozyma hubeiensis]|nr:Protein-tyrosine-phosphatase [Pseudozyma hubeiensis]
MNSHEADLSPPPTPGPSSFAPRPMQSSKPSRAPARSLSLRIPEDGQAFGGLTQPSLASALPRSPVLHTSAPHITLQSANNQAGPSTLAPPPQSRLSRKRPSRLNLAPPSQSADESGQSSRSMPNSPVTLSRSPSHAEQAETTAPPASAISEAVKHLSSTLRGTPRRRPSMPFKPATAQETAYPEPPSAASSRSRPPEAFRDPSEHILSGKGSTLQHARSVYSHGPVEVLPGLFLGDEHNARDSDTLSALGITTILNVAKETVLDFQTECGSSSVYPSAAHPTWSNSAMSRQHGASSAGYQEPPTPSTYFTPPASASLSRPKAPGEASSPRDAISVSVLRNTSSTPNLLTHFVNGEFTGPPESAALHTTEADSISTSDLRTLTAQDVLRYRSLRRTSDSSSDDAFGTASSPSSSRAASTCTSAATELTPPALMQLKHSEDAETNDNASSTYAFDDDSQSSPCAWFTKVELPSNATAITVPASIEHGRTHQMRYVKLPWTHDETDLASARGGFAQGIALIAEALGIDDHFWYAAKIADDGGACAALQDDSVSLQHIQTDPSPGKILVHCQCGVSRSATLVIAFVMQAAAMRYGFEAARSLLGMHDCYNMVKEKSSSISPNISLIYQLVEWERYLSSSAGRLRDALGMGSMGNGGEVDGHTNANGHSSLAAAGWSTEPMDEAMWSKMRLEEEEKEAVEEERRRQERLDEAMRLAAERRAAQDRLEGRVPVEGAVEGADTGSGSLMQRRRKNRAPTLQLQTSATPAVLGAPPAVAPVPSPGLQRRRPPALQLNSATRAGAGDVGRSELETPFHTARLEAWTGHEQDADGDVTMNEPEPPQTPLRSSAADYDTASTPTARTTAAAYGGDSTSSALRTPNASSAWAPSPKTLVHAPSKEDLPFSELSAAMLPVASARRASTHGSIPTTLVSPSSPAMAPSLSTGSRPNRFSFGGAPLSGSLTARLGGDAERSRSRPDSMQSAMSSSSSSTALFGVTALSREERKKQHRRTFSSDWPTLQANLLSQQRRKSKVDMLAPPGMEAEGGAATTTDVHTDAMDV